MIGSWEDAKLGTHLYNTEEGEKLKCIGQRPMIDYANKLIGLPKDVKSIIHPSILTYKDSHFVND